MLFCMRVGCIPVLELEVQATSKMRAVRYSLRQPFAIVGRHPAADVYLDSDGIRPLQRPTFRPSKAASPASTSRRLAPSRCSEAEVENFCWLNPHDSVHFGNLVLKLIQEEDDGRAYLPKGQPILDPLAVGSAWEIYGPRITLEILNEEEGTTRKTWLVDRLR